MSSVLIFITKGKAEHIFSFMHTEFPALGIECGRSPDNEHSRSLENLIMNHTQRDFRASQLAAVLEPFELKEALHIETIPVEYVNRQRAGTWQKKRRLTGHGLDCTFA